MRGPDRQVLSEQDVEERAERGPEQAAHAADDNHRQQFAGGRNRRRIRRCKAVVEGEQHSRNAGESRRHHVGDQPVALGRIADELRPLLVFANREQHAADR